ncbi:unnamed protein product [Vitrella brassicaformis CCMP3155]|uniref:RCC1-like domain-containing protein n=1 Tax=Vitrella brassicaformis (strain CCMP3155) TaxID=1169540 RepID=A0A0G4G543_VITBC|nr:unnamed protein product [Vitrella brassicaformis CCMP3155]|eukprot:CEM23223.1 unnamed protein product [Vitrella brassicaformis CCMP3155]
MALLITVGRRGAALAAARTSSRCFSSSPATSTAAASSPQSAGGPGATTLWRWGCTGHSSFLGNSTSEASKTPSRIEGFNDTTVIAVGSEHAAFVDSGKLYTYGANKYRQLGRPSRGPKADEDNEPGLVELDVASPIVQLACGAFHTAALTADGRLFTWGWGGSFFSGCNGLGHGDRKTRETPTEVSKFIEIDDPVKYVTCGYQQTLALTASNTVYGCGKGEFGRLGRGHNSDQLEFEEVEYFSTLFMRPEILKLTTGTNHSIALTKTGELYVWGRNDRGQLGTSDGTGDIYSCEMYPRHLRSLVLEGIQMADVEAGDDFCVSVSASGVIYFWGRSVWLEPKPITLNPQYANAPIKGHVFKVDAGINYAMAVTEEGELYSWGKPSSGCLGRDNPKETIEPVLVPNELFGGQLVHDVACGRYRVLAVTRENPNPPPLTQEGDRGASLGGEEGQDRAAGGGGEIPSSPPPRDKTETA